MYWYLAFSPLCNQKLVVSVLAQFWLVLAARWENLIWNDWQQQNLDWIWFWVWQPEITNIPTPAAAGNDGDSQHGSIVAKSNIRKQLKTSQRGLKSQKQNRSLGWDKICEPWNLESK